MQSLHRKWGNRFGALADYRQLQICVGQVVAFQAMLKYMSDRFPGAFSGYTLSVTESHQASKVDTSGTAKAVIQSFQALGTHMDGVTLLHW